MVGGNSIKHRHQQPALPDWFWRASVAAMDTSGFTTTIGTFCYLLPQFDFWCTTCNKNFQHLSEYPQLPLLPITVDNIALKNYCHCHIKHFYNCKYHWADKLPSVLPLPQIDVALVLLVAIARGWSKTIAFAISNTYHCHWTETLSLVLLLPHFAVLVLLVVIAGGWSNVRSWRRRCRPETFSVVR